MKNTKDHIQSRHEAPKTVSMMLLRHRYAALVAVTNECRDRATSDHLHTELPGSAQNFCAELPSSAQNFQVLRRSSDNLPGRRVSSGCWRAPTQRSRMFCGSQRIRNEVAMVSNECSAQIREVLRRTSQNFQVLRLLRRTS